MGEKIDDAHHVLRHVKGTSIVDVPGAGVTVLHTAFQRREGEDSLSCAWLEFYDGDQDAQLQAAVGTFRQVMVIRPKSGFVRGNVGQIKDAGTLHACKVRVLRDPMPDHEAHSEVRQLDDGNQELLSLLADDAWSDLRISNTIP